jgi:hypothetical protein
VVVLLSWLCDRERSPPRGQLPRDVFGCYERTRIQENTAVTVKEVLDQKINTIRVDTIVGAK